MESTIKQKGKRYSFFQLFTEQDYTIEVPVIQRDFAQGRKSKTEVRDLFLKALYDYLDENVRHRDLDFVYGSTEITDGLEKFIPLDGQQRLTTLFLLHWYLATISGNIASLRNILFSKNKSKFSYQTRTSSSEFCDALFKNEVDIKNLLVSKDTRKESLAETIKDSHWYFLSWGKDPTIQSMLIMLDAIHEKFSKRPDFFQRIIDNANPIITFLYLDLGEFGLTEDLYIKMNSRGKPLTTFENFKAKLEQHISVISLDDEVQFFLVFETVRKKVNTKEYFSFNIDTKWANLFWQYRDLGGNKNTFDDELMNFIYVLAANEFAVNNDFNKEVFQYLVKGETSDLDTAEYISFNKLYNINALSKGFIMYLIESFDNLSNGNSTVKMHLKDSKYYDEEEMFKKAITNKLSWPSRIQFHAYLSFLIVNKKDRTGLFQWMRFVHNITENTPIDSADVYVRAIKSIQNLLQSSNDILSFLIDEKNRVDFFSARQIQEERIKAHLISRDVSWKSAIESFEMRAFFTGQIMFMFEFSGILDYYENFSNCNWPEVENSKYYENFNVYASKASNLFDIVGTSANRDYILERAVLTKGVYLVPAGNKLNFLSTNKDQRDYSWKRLLRLSPSGDNDSKSWRDRRGFVKELLDDEKFNEKQINTSLKSIAQNTPDDWRKYFIDNPDLIRYCQQGFIQFLSENQIYLVLQFQDNSRKREMRTYNLYTFELPPDTIFEPFEAYWHEEINRENEYSFMILNNWCFKRKYYAIEISYWENEELSKGFFIIDFYKKKGDTNISDYADEIVDILKQRKFEWNDEESVFRNWRENEATTIKLLKELCQAFNNVDYD